MKIKNELVQEYAHGSIEEQRGLQTMRTALAILESAGMRTAATAPYSVDFEDGNMFELTEKSELNERVDGHKSFLVCVAAAGERDDGRLDQFIIAGVDMGFGCCPAFAHNMDEGELSYTPVYLQTIGEFAKAPSDEQIMELVKLVHEDYAKYREAEGLAKATCPSF